MCSVFWLFWLSYQYLSCDWLERLLWGSLTVVKSSPERRRVSMIFFIYCIVLLRVYFIFPTAMAWCSLFVLKVSLNTKQTNKPSCNRVHTKEGITVTAWSDLTPQSQHGLISHHSHSMAWSHTTVTVTAWSDLTPQSQHSLISHHSHSMVWSHITVTAWPDLTPQSQSQHGLISHHSHSHSMAWSHTTVTVTAWSDLTP